MKFKVFCRFDQEKNRKIENYTKIVDKMIKFKYIKHIVLKAIPNMNKEVLMAATIYDVAADAKVSISTVSRVLNDSESVSDSLRQRVLQSIEKFNYKPSAAARSLITKKTNMIAIIVADILNPITAKQIKEIDQYCRKRKKLTITCDYDCDNNKAIDLLDNMLEKQVDGVVFMGVTLNDQLLEKLKEFDCPVVLANQGVESKKYDFTIITDDSYHATRDVTYFLINEGHQRIAYIGGEQSDYTNGKLRLKGFLNAMKENNLAVPESYVIQGEFTLEAGKKGMKNIYETNMDLPTAVIAGSDMIAVGIIRYLKTVGIKVPEDISVFGFDDSVSDIFELPLSTVRSCDRGKIICEQLFADQTSKEKEWLYFPYKVLRRNSTKRISKR